MRPPGTTASVSVGRIRWEAWSQMPERVSPIPVAGRIPRLTENSTTSTMPSQYCGTDMPAMATAPIERSERDAGNAGEQDRPARELEGVQHRRHDLGDDRAPGGDRRAEVAGQHAAKPKQVLHRRRL